MIRGFENNLDEMKAIDYLDSLDKRILMTREEGKLAQLVIKYKEAIENLTTMTVCGDGKQIKNTAQYKLEKLQDRIDKAIETIEQLKKGSYIEYTDTTALAYHTPQSCCIARLDVIEKILRGEEDES